MLEGFFYLIFFYIFPSHHRTHWYVNYPYIYIYIYIYCDESVASPLIISISPSLIPLIPHPRACTLVSSWVQEGSVERGGPPRETADGPGCRAVPLEAPRAQRRTKPLIEAAALASRTSEGSACGHRTPPLTWTLPSRTLPLLHNPRSTTRTPDPLFILDTSSPLDTLFYYFCSIKASPRPVVCSSRHSGGECGQGGA